MADYIDIHSHIMPDVDDGADSFATSMQMLRMAAESDIAQVILTPHNKPAHRNVSPETMEEKQKRLQKSLEAEKIGIKLHAGSELYYRSGLSEELEQGKALTLAGSHYVLTEFGPMDDYDYIRNGIYSLLMSGYYPILAHLERYQNLCAKPSRVGELIEMGAYVQINAGSIMGKHGLGTKLFTQKLLKQHLVHFVATDAHDLQKRTARLSECAHFLQKKYGKEYKEELLCQNPMRVLTDSYITN